MKAFVERIFIKLKDTIDIGVNDFTDLTAQAVQEFSLERSPVCSLLIALILPIRFNAINDAAAVSRRADQVSAAAFYVVNINDANNSGNWRGTADLYRQDAPAAFTETQ